MHIANTYEFWIGKTALQKEVTFTTYEATKSINDVTTLFVAVDSRMVEFIALLKGSACTAISYEINGQRGTTDAFTLFSHVVTHEFHHKGQILSISRHLGYIPVDTDIMR